MRRVTALLVSLVLLAGCGSEEPETPVACLGTADSYLSALEEAPGEVRLDGTTPISDCVISAQEAGALGSVGKATVTAATRLNAQARRDPTGDATVQLGYLVGAIQEGAAQTGGVHADLVRRLDSAARSTASGETPPAGFERAFGEGYAAGQSGG